MDALDDQAIRDELSSKLTGWKHKDDKIHRSFSFDDFRAALGFIIQVGFLAEEQMHHPEIFNVYNNVKISLTTHDAGDKVTEKDMKLAEAIEKLYN